MPDEAEPNVPRESLSPNRNNGGFGEGLPAFNRPTLLRLERQLRGQRNRQAEIMDLKDYETIRPEGYFCCRKFKIRPASHFSFFCVITLFRAFNAVLTLDMITCVLYSVFILVDEI